MIWSFKKSTEKHWVKGTVLYFSGVLSTWDPGQLNPFVAKPAERAALELGYQLLQTGSTLPHPPIHYPVRGHGMGGLESVPLIMWREAGYTLDRLSVHHRANIKRKTTSHAHTCAYTVGGSWTTQRELIHTRREHANSTLISVTLTQTSCCLKKPTETQNM